MDSEQKYYEDRESQEWWLNKAREYSNRTKWQKFINYLKRMFK
jgi:glycogen debranching enzyme